MGYQRRVLGGLKQLYRRNSKGSLIKNSGGLDAEGACISLGDFEDKLCDEKVRAFFEAIDIDTTDAWTLFKLLDRQGTGQVKAGEFVEGCMRMRGPAKNVQLANLQYESKHLRATLVDFMQSVEMEFEDLYNREHIVSQRLLQQLQPTRDPPAPQSTSQPSEPRHPVTPSNDEAPWMLTACCSPMKRPPKITPSSPSTSIWSNPFFGGTDGLICALPASRSTPPEKIRLPK